MYSIVKTYVTEAPRLATVGKNEDVNFTMNGGSKPKSMVTF